MDEFEVVDASEVPPPDSQSEEELKEKLNREIRASSGTVLRSAKTTTWSEASSDSGFNFKIGACCLALCAIGVSSLVGNVSINSV